MSGVRDRKLAAQAHGAMSTLAQAMRETAEDGAR